MARGRRVLGVLLVAVAMIGGAAAPALAGPPAPALPAPGAPAPAVVVDEGCDPPAPVADGYAPSVRCELLLVRAEAICLGDAPVLDYAVEPVGTPGTTVTLTWVNPAGDDLVQTGLPLSGRVSWPGTVIENGEVVDWPGWTKDETGAWTEHDAYDFTRPQVGLVLEVNPSVSTVVAYPPASAVCAGPRVEQVAGVQTTSGVLAAPEVATVAAPAPAPAATAVLAVTGANTTPLLVGAGALVLLGLALVGVAARRHRHAG